MENVIACGPLFGASGNSSTTRTVAASGGNGTGSALSSVSLSSWNHSSREFRHVLGSGLHGGFGGRLLGTSANLSPEPRDRVVVSVDDAFFNG